MSRPALPKHVLFLLLAAVAVAIAMPLFSGASDAAGVKALHAASSTRSSTSPPTRGMPGDFWADVIIGKPRYSEISPFSTVGNKLFWAHGVIVDRTSSPNKLYIYDSGNNRILGFDLSTCLSRPGDPLNCSADIVLGQVDMAHSGCNGDSGFQSWPMRAPASASTLCGQQESQMSITEGGSGSSMAVDPSGNLYVTDFFNHRVLRYDSPFSTDRAADAVWGQADFSGNTCNKGLSAPNATTLCFTWGNSNNWTAGVEVDPQGNLWVVDSGNNRVLRFPQGSNSADLVLGQPNFASRSPGSTLDKFNAPAAVRLNSRGWLYVADQGNDRVLVFRPPFSTYMSGRRFGPSLPPNPNPEPFWGPSGVDFDPNLPGVWIMNTNHSTLERWDEDAETLVQTIGRRDDGNLLFIVTGSVGIDSAGNKFVVGGSGSGHYRGDTLMFAPDSPGTSPTKRLFGNVWVGNQMTAASLASAAGVAVSDNHLMVGDEGRIMFWNNPHRLIDGQAASGVAGRVADFTSYRDGCCHNLKSDTNHHLWATAYHSTGLPDRVELYQLPLTTGASPLRSLQLPLPVLGGGQISATANDQRFWGVAPTANSAFLWISHPDTNRVFRVRNPLSNPVVDVILGQHNLSGTLCNRGGAPRVGMTPTTLCYPGSLSLDRHGNLYVSDHSLEARGNMRLLMFEASLFPPDNNEVIYAPFATKIFDNIATWEPAFNSLNHMVVGYNPYWPNNPTPTGASGESAVDWQNPFDALHGRHPHPHYPQVYLYNDPDNLDPWQRGRFPGIYMDPLSTSTRPDEFLRDYHSMSFAATFDELDNLYVGDLNRARVLIYKNPLRTPASCAIAFSDVLPENAFYASVRCLACRGIISGYADGTFKPDNLVTRGQLAKIVSNAAGFNEDPDPQIYEDVPFTNPFYEWINRLSRRGYMSGYSCGGPGEPCIDNMPYFRPFANATRAQTSKIVSNAALYNDPPQGQTFEDVPPAHPFYVEIQRLASRGIMGGYNCGGPGEPCGPENRPYFRPYNDVTRGQSAKIVANTFYPDCQTP